MSVLMTIHIPERSSGLIYSNDVLESNLINGYY